MVLDIAKLSMHLTFTEDEMRECLDHPNMTKLDVGASFNAIRLLIPKDLQGVVSRKSRFFDSPQF